jgi:hypothetical protein
MPNPSKLVSKFRYDRTIPAVETVDGLDAPPTHCDTPQKTLLAVPVRTMSRKRRYLTGLI